MPRAARPQLTARCLVWNLLALLLLPGVATAAQEQAFGRAYKPGTTDLLYTETYTPGVDDKVLVVYEDVQGKPIAQKELDFSVAPFAPDMLNEDFRLGTRLQIDTSAAGIAIAQEGGKKKAFNAVVKPVSNLVIDAGFNNFVREHWDALIAGERKSIHFLVPARKTAVKLRVKQRSCPETPAAKASTISEARQCFSIKAKNWLIAAAMKTINLEYDAGSRRLLRFTGLGQLPDGRGKSQRIDLHYDYDVSDSNSNRE